MDEYFNRLAAQVGELLLARQQKIVTVESCTGGWVAQALTSVPGCSAWFERGYVTYSNEAKQELVGVKEQTLIDFGAVSEQTALEMAQGALAHSHADAALAITGIAGPGGGSDTKPVGTVCFAWAGSSFSAMALTRHFYGNRAEIRQQAVEFSLKYFLEKFIESF